MRKFNKKFISIILSIIIVITSVSIPVNVSAAGSDKEAPSAPTNLQVASKTCTSIDLSWTASTDNVGVTTYYVYSGTTLLGTTTGTTFSITSLTPDTAYSYTIKAEDKARNLSAASEVLNVTTLADTEAPSAPGNLQAGYTSSSTVYLSWTASTDNIGITGYNLYSGTTQIGTAIGTTFTANNLTPKTSYNFTVKAKDAAGNLSTASNNVNVITQGTTSPTATRSFFVASTYAELEFIPPTANDIVVNAYWIDDGTTLSYLSTTKDSPTEGSLIGEVNGLTPNTTYTFRIVAQDMKGYLHYSNPINFTTLSQGFDFGDCIERNGNELSYDYEISWNAPTGDLRISVYDIYLEPLENDRYENIYIEPMKVGSTTETKYPFYGLKTNYWYGLYIYAKDAEGNIIAAEHGAFGCFSGNSLAASESVDPPVTPSDAFWADPVDTGSGAHKIKEDVLKAKGAQDLAFTLSYDSSKLCSGDMGKGWSNNYEINLEKQTDGSVFVYWTPSQYSQFSSIGGGIYTCNNLGKQNDILTQNADGSYVLNCNDDVKYSFDSTGQLTNIQNRNKMNINVTRDGSGNLLITEPISGKTLTVVYNIYGLVQSVSDSSGRTVTFGYNGNGLNSITYPDGKSTTYLYDYYGHITKGTDGDGTVYFTDTYDSQGRIKSQDDSVDGNNLTYFSYDTTSVSGQTTVTITDRNGKTRKNVFNSLHQLISVMDENGNTKSYSYDAKGNLLSETDELGNTTTSVYDNYNHLTHQTDKTGLVTDYTYDTNGNMLTQTNPDEGTITYTYDDKNRVTSITDLRGNLTTYTYDSDGLLSEKNIGGNISTYTYEKGLIKTVTDSNNGVTTYAYDEAGYPKTMTDSNGKVWNYTYDAVGNLLSKTDPLGNITSFTYDSRGNILTQTDANGKTTTYQYNGNGKVSTVTDPKGGITTYYYDGEDRVTQIKDVKGYSTYKTYDPAGRVLSEKDAKGNITSYTYDAVGNTLTKTAPKGGVTTYTYYTNGKINTMKDAAGNITTYYYDQNWNLSKVTNAAGKDTIYQYNAVGGLLSVTDPLGNVTSYTYDNFGNVLTETDPNGNVTTYTYDSENNRTSLTDALGNETTYTYDAMNRLLTSTDALLHTTSYTYDDAGRLLSTTDALGNITSIVRDGNGNVTTTTDPLGNSTSYTYDSFNLQTSLTDDLGNKTDNTFDSLGRLLTTTDPLGNVTTYDYDENGRIISATDALGGISSQVYDVDGNVTSVTNPIGGSTTYSYDTSDRLTEESTTSNGTISYTYNSLNLLSERTNARGQNRTYTYDDAGRILSFTDSEGTTTYTYDKNGNVLTVTDSKGTITREFDKLNRVTKYIDVNGNTIQYTYDEVGNLSSIIYPDSKTVNYTYDAVNRMKTVTDWALRVTSYDYDAAGNLINTNRPDGSVQTRTYDSANRLTSINDVDANNNVITKYEYSYDADGHILTETASNEQTTTVLTYDANGRVTSRQVKDSSEKVIANNTYDYDAAGNITSSGTTGMIYDNQNRLTTCSGSSITYDEDGNMTSNVVSGSAMNFTYDSRNRLMEAGDLAYAYDADNNRISSSLNGNTTNYVYDTQGSLSRLLMSTDANGNNTYYVYGIGLIGSQEESGNYSIYHYDYRGSTTAITDMSGTVTDRYTYGTYGNLESHTGSSTTPFLYNGRDGVMTDLNGLYYLRTRYYSPELMRFINADIVKGTIANGETLNRYAYANGNPVSLIDPFGTSAEPGSETAWNDRIANYLKDSEAYKWFVKGTQDGSFPAFFDIGGFYRDENGVYHARQNYSLQSFKYSGYNDFYDYVFDLATDMGARKYQFSTENEDYIVWLWKGDYLNLGAGAETGIYSGGGPHWLIDKKLSMPMTLSLQNKDGNTIFDWKPEDKNWWCTGFNPMYQNVKAADVTSKGSIDFSEHTDLWNAFYDTYQSDPFWTFNPDSHVATYEWKN